MPRPAVIVFEGFDATGKTTIASWLAQFYGYGYRKSPAGRFARARSVFDESGTPTLERFCFYLGDSIHASAAIQAARDSNSSLVLDRYYYSTIAYHEALQPGISSQFATTIQSLAQPDLIFYLTVPFDVLLTRYSRSAASTNDPLFLTPAMYRHVTDIYPTLFNVTTVAVSNHSSLNETKAVISAYLDHA